jgi:hypothetical protein
MKISSDYLSIAIQWILDLPVITATSLSSFVEFQDPWLLAVTCSASNI